MRKDWLLFVNIVLIVAIGFTTLYSTVVGKETLLGGGGIINKQLMFIFIGIILYFIVSYFNYSYTGHLQVLIPIYIILLIGLIYLLLFGVEINYAKRWLFIGGVQLQISEFVKIASIMITAYVMSQYKRYPIYLLAGISLLISLPLAYLIFRQPDASTAILTIIINALIIFTVLPGQLRNLVLLLLATISGIILNLIISKVFGISTIIFVSLLIAFLVISFFIEKEKKWLIVIALFVGLITGAGLRYSWDNVLEDYQKQRVETFINPQADTQGAAFQVNQAKVAIGSGLLLGKGFGHGTQSKLKFLPEHQTDFIFAAFSEEFGLMGASFLLVLYAFLTIRMIRIATLTNDMYGYLICVGVSIKFLLEVLINIGMNLGMTPATGVALPLMSAGGSGFITTMIAFGLVQSVLIHRDLIDTI